MPDPTPAVPAVTTPPPSPPPAPDPQGTLSLGGNGAAAVPALGTIPPPAPPPAPPPPTPAPVPSALADWRAGLTEPEHKEFAAKLASPADAVKVAWDLRKQNAGMIKKPADLASATEEERAQFRKAIGVPDSAGDYEFDLGREATEQDKTVQKEVARIAHETGVPKAALKALSKGVTELARAQAAEADRVALNAREAATVQLRKEMGSDYDGNLELARRAMDKFGGKGMLDVIESATLNGAKLGDHPDVIRTFVLIGRRMGEGDYIGAVGSSERTQAQERINQLMTANPPGTEKYKDPAVQRELSELHQKLYGNEPVAGFGGRLV